MPRDLFQLILDDNTPVSFEAYGVLASMLKAEHPEGWKQ
jgi:hypothetical protein